jgi:hypothetical protein
LSRWRRAGATLLRGWRGVRHRCGGECGIGVEASTVEVSR